MKKLPITQDKSTIKSAMKTIDESGLGIAFIVDNNKNFVGVVTDGNIRRHIINGGRLNEVIGKITNKDSVVICKEWSEQQVIEYLKRKDIKSKVPPLGSISIPIINNKKKVVGVYHYSEASKKRFDTTKNRSAVKRVLVVGGAGYIGSILCRKLLEKGYYVKVLDNLTYGDKGIKELYSNTHFRLIKGDMRNLSTVVEAIKSIDAVIHLAAIVGDPASNIDPQKTIEINYLSTKLVAEACKYHQVNRFIFASTCSIYGINLDTQKTLTEEDYTNPISLYAEMKLRSEEGLMELLDDNFSPTILRLSTVYGWSPRMRFDLVVNLLTAKATIEKQINIFGGKQWRPNICVDDVCEAFIRCLEAPIKSIRGEIINVGSEKENYMIEEIGDKIREIIPKTRIITTENEDNRSYKVNFDKIERLLGFKTQKTMEESIKEIQENIKQGRIKDYRSKEYSNYKLLANTIS